MITIQLKLPLRALAGGVGLLAALSQGLLTAQAAPHKVRLTRTQADALVLKRFPGRLTAKTMSDTEHEAQGETVGR